MIIRRMTEEDLEQVAELEKSIFSTPWSKAAFSESLQRPYSHFFVAEADERRTGEDNAVDDAGMVEFIGDNRVFFRRDRLE